MLTHLRRAQILADAQQQGGVSLRELSHRFDVSIPTIRRDLSALADQGLMRRVHGGAVMIGTGHGRPAAALPAAGPALADGSGGELYVARPAAGLAEAVDMVAPGMAVGISGGPVAVQLAGLLDGIHGLTIVTPVPAVAQAIRTLETVVVLVGGVRTPSGSHAGPLTEKTLQRLNLNIAFVEQPAGTVIGDELAAQTDRQLLARAVHRIHLAA